MGRYRKLTHVYYKCDYHIVFTPKCRFRVLEGMVKSLEEYDLQVISIWKGVIIQEMNVQKDNIHLVCSILPKVYISELVGVLKGKMAIKLFKTYPSPRQKPYLGNHFWSRGYFVSTVGLDEEMIKRYVMYEEHHE